MKEYIKFEDFKDRFISQFVFKPIERPRFTEWLNVHFIVYKMLYKDIVSIEDYAEIAFNDELQYCQSYGMILISKL